MKGSTKKTEIFAVPEWGVNFCHPPPDFNSPDGVCWYRIHWPINTALVFQEQKKVAEGMVFDEHEEPSSLY